SLEGRLNLGAFGRAGAIDRVGKHKEALHPSRTGVVEIAAVFGFEHLIDDVAVATRLADVVGAAIDGALGQIADIGDESRIGEAGIVADDDRRQVVEVLHRPKVEDRVGGVASKDADVRLEPLELDDVSRDIGAIGIVGDLRRNVDIGRFGGILDAGRDRGAVIRVLVDDGDFVDLSARVFQIGKKTGIGFGKIG